MNNQTRAVWSRKVIRNYCILVAGVINLTVLTSLCTMGEEPEARGPTIEPDHELQAQIKRAMHPRTEEEWDQQLDKLRKLGGRNYKKLIPQLLYYSMHGTDFEGHHDSMKEGMALDITTGRLNIRKRTIAHSLIPYIETPDMALRKKIRHRLQHYEDASARRPPNFDLYQSIIAHNFRKGKESSPGLVRYMYERDPGTALLTMKQAALQDRDEIRQITWAEHVISNVLWKHKHKFLKPDEVEPAAAEQLDKLSRSKHWWARLYVAHIMRQHRGFRRAEIIERLKKDDNQLVREAMQFADKMPTKKPGRD